jgi:hypothetical protein
MQQHASKECDNESDATPRIRLINTLTKMREQYPAEQQDERPMQVNANPENEPSFSDHFIDVSRFCDVALFREIQ